MNNEADSTPLVSIIIPVFNNVNLTKRCVETILKTPPSLPFEIIIVDDHSEDGTAHYLAYLSRRYPFIRTLRNERNSGFAVGCNRGARKARGSHLVFLNNDTIPLPGWLEALLDTLRRDDRIAVVGAKLLYPKGTIQHAGVLFRNFPFPIAPFHVYAGKPADLPEANFERDYDVVTAACMLVRRKVFEELGGFDERFINGYEDVDFCLRVREAGYRVVYTPRSVLYHLESASPGRFNHSISNIRILHRRWMGKIRYVVRKEPRVSVIMVNYNGWDDTIEALSSLFTRETYERFNVIVVDNASQTDRSSDIETFCRQRGVLYRLIEDTVPPPGRFEREVFLLQLPSNRGFGGGSNEGIRLALSLGADYVWLLNNDTLLEDNALYFLISLAEYFPNAAIVGSKLHCYPETEKIQFDGFSVSYRGTTTSADFPEKILEVQFVSGASMLIRCDFLKRFGLLREDYFLYFEDNEICLRAIRNGFTVIYNPLSVVYHKGGASIGDFMESPVSIYYGIRNSFFFREEWNKKGIEETLRLVEKVMFPKLFHARDMIGLKALLQAIEDYLSDKKGKRDQDDRSEEFSLSYTPEYTRLLKHLSQLGKIILKSQSQNDLVTSYFDTVRTAINLRLAMSKSTDE